MWPDFPLFPRAASAHAASVDHLTIAWVAISIFFSVLIAVLILYFFTRYRRRSPDEIGHTQELNTIPLEVTWSAIPLVIALAMFVWGTRLFFDVSRPPSNAVEYYVVAKQWMWKFQHPEGNREINDLHVPVGQAIKLTMTSQDVIHSLYLPAFRVKADVLPGRYTTIWFRATKPGTYHLYCAEYCGTEHSKMRGSVTVMDPQDYEQWLATSSAGTTMVTSGAQLFRQLACDTCHGEGGSKGALAPPLVGLYGHRVELHDGSSVEADGGYLRESILDPQAKIVAGWQPVMPTYRGQLSEDQVNALVEYVKTLGATGAKDGKPSPAPAGSTEG